MRRKRLPRQQMVDLLTWRLEGLICSVDGDPAHAPLEVELDVVPLAVVERQAGGAHVDGPRPQVEVHVQVALQQLHREVVLEERKKGTETGSVIPSEKKVKTKRNLQRKSLCLIFPVAQMQSVNRSFSSGGLNKQMLLTEGRNETRQVNKASRVVDWRDSAWGGEESEERSRLKWLKGP